MKFRRKPRENIDINLASLIDVVFILLLFFVVSTTFNRETQLKIDLPEAASGIPAEQNDTASLEILIDAQGNFSLKGQALLNNDLDTLVSALGKEADGDTRVPLVISADGQSPHQAVVTAMDAAGKLGFTHLRITTTQAEPAGKSE